ncbi:hypothetical protein [Phytohabitans rumicis]|uniref:DUF3592 domain-containing protein n=1 Tax=Phytohabitans rumicis TaxID=1076125 RepID=A0A6V8LPQ7_9ACTN|nr:hypothetical protein [Phytohabitans rumicis]GFJ96077.1 hypothetical protein Prum_097190 [Phytohabitans rumicis]
MIDPRRLFKRAAGFVAVFVGVIVLVTGVQLTVSRTWPTATGTVQSCTTDWVGTGRDRRIHYDCVVTWTDGARQRTASVDFGRDAQSTGAPVTLRVRGDSAALDGPAWAGYAALAVGLALTLGGGAYLVRALTLAIRARRRAR